MHTLVAPRLLASPEYTACQKNVPAVVNVTGSEIGHHPVGDRHVPAGIAPVVHVLLVYTV